MRNGLLNSSNLRILAPLKKFWLLFPFALNHTFLTKQVQEKSKILQKKPRAIQKRGNEEIIQTQIFC